VLFSCGIGNGTGERNDNQRHSEKLALVEDL
jgi:hypothetical protein